MYDNMFNCYRARPHARFNAGITLYICLTSLLGVVSSNHIDDPEMTAGIDDGVRGRGHR